VRARTLAASEDILEVDPGHAEPAAKNTRFTETSPPISTRLWTWIPMGSKPVRRSRCFGRPTVAVDDIVPGSALTAPVDGSSCSTTRHWQVVWNASGPTGVRRLFRPCLFRPAAVLVTARPKAKRFPMNVSSSFDTPSSQTSTSILVRTTPPRIYAAYRDLPPRMVRSVG